VQQENARNRTRYAHERSRTRIKRARERANEFTNTRARKWERKKHCDNIIVAVCLHNKVLFWINVCLAKQICRKIVFSGGKLLFSPNCIQIPKRSPNKKRPTNIRQFSSCNFPLSNFLTHCFEAHWNKGHVLCLENCAYVIFHIELLAYDYNLEGFRAWWRHRKTIFGRSVQNRFSPFLLLRPLS